MGVYLIISLSCLKIYPSDDFSDTFHGRNITSREGCQAMKEERERERGKKKEQLNATPSA